jgi:copper transport protein
VDAVKALDLSRRAPVRVVQRALTTIVLGGLLLVVALMGSQRAHAQDANSLQSIEPENGSTLEASPETIVLSFNQELRTSDRPIVVLSCGAPMEAQALGSPEVDPEGLIVTWEVLAPLPRGACNISWRLADADGNSLLGPELSTFSVDADPPPTVATTTTIAGGASITSAPPVSFVTADAGSTSSSSATPQGSSGGALWLGRMLSTLGIMALFGGLALIALGWPEGPEYVVTVRYLRAVWLLALVGTVLYLIAYSARFNDVSFGSAVNPSTWLDLNDAGWPGRGALLRLVTVAASGWVAMRPERIIDPTSAMWGWALPGASLVAVALSRVDGPGAWIGVLVGLGHVLTGAIWFGGVALVARVVLAGPGEEDLLHATRAFSRMSTKAMLAVVITGIIQVVRLVGNPFDSSHGRVLLLKTVFVAAMVAVGLEARRQVAFRLDRAHEMTVPLADRFRRAFGAEAAIGVVVLAFSGWLLGLTPAKVERFGDESYARTINFVDPTTNIDAAVSLGPLQVGKNGFRIEVNAPQEGISQLTLRFIPPDGSGLGVIEQPIRLTTAGTMVLRQVNGLPFDVAGQWTIELAATTTTGTQPGQQSTFEVLGGESGGSTATQPEGTVPAAVTETTLVPAPAVSASFVTTSTTSTTTSTTVP